MVSELEDADLRHAHLSVVRVAEVADDDDAIARQCRAVEIGWRKDVRWVAKDVRSAVRIADDDVIIDVEIRIVEVLVLAGDEHDATVGEVRLALPEPLKAPARIARGFQRVEALTRRIGRHPRGDEPVPNRIGETLGVRRPKPRRAPLAKQLGRYQLKP